MIINWVSFFFLCVSLYPPFARFSLLRPGLDCQDKNLDYHMFRNKLTVEHSRLDLLSACIKPEGHLWVG